jgi:hypothetical protein
MVQSSQLIKELWARIVGQELRHHASITNQAINLLVDGQEDSEVIDDHCGRIYRGVLQSSKPIKSNPLLC